MERQITKWKVREGKLIATQNKLISFPVVIRIKNPADPRTRASMRKGIASAKIFGRRQGGFEDENDGTRYGGRQNDRLDEICQHYEWYSKAKWFAQISNANEFHEVV